MNIQFSCSTKKRLAGFASKLLLVIVFLSVSLAGLPQVQFSLGGSGGYNQSMNQFYKMPRTNVDELPDFNFGVDGILGINDWLRVKAEIHYANMSFTRYWNIDGTLPNRIDKSNVTLNNLNISPKVDLRFLKIGDFDLYFSTGFRFEFLLGKYEVSYTANGQEMDNTYVTDKYNEGQAGVVGGLIFKYNFSPQWSLTLSPEYTYFFNPLYSMKEYPDENRYDLQRLGLNIGFEWRF